MTKRLFSTYVLRRTKFHAKLAFGVSITRVNQANLVDDRRRRDYSSYRRSFISHADTVFNNGLINYMPNTTIGYYLILYHKIYLLILLINY